MMNTITILRQLDTTNLPHGAKLYVGGYYTSGDGGGGVFRYDINSTDADDGGLVIAPNGGVGRYHRIVNEPVNVKWFGAKGDGSSTDTPYFQAAVDAGAALGRAVYVPAGDYILGRVDITAQVRIFGDDAETTKLLWSTNEDYPRVLYVTADDCVFEDLQVSGNDTMADGFVGSYGLIEFQAVTGGVVRNCAFSSTRGIGVVANRSGEIHVEGCRFVQCFGGVYGNTQGGDPCYDNRVVGCKMRELGQGTSGIGIRFAGTDAGRQYSIKITDNDIESLGTLQSLDLYRGNFDALVSGNRFAYTNWGMSIGHGIKGVIEGNQFIGNVEYGIELAEGCEQCVVSNNIVDGNDPDGVAVLQDGIAVIQGDHVGFNDPFDNVITGNVVGPGADDSRGVYLYECTNAIVSNNVIRGMELAIYGQDASGMIITGNTLAQPRSTDGTHILFQNATVNNNGTLIANNTFSGEVARGIQVENTGGQHTQDLTVQGNVCSGLVASVRAFNSNDFDALYRCRVRNNTADDPTSVYNAFNFQRTIGAVSTISPCEETVLCGDAGNYAVNLEIAANNIGRRITFKKIGGSSNTATITPNGSETIDGAASYALQTVNKYVTLEAYSAGWLVIANN